MSYTVTALVHTRIAVLELVPMVTKVLPGSSAESAFERRLPVSQRGAPAWQYAAPSEADFKDRFCGTTLPAEGSRGVMLLAATLQLGVGTLIPRFMGYLFNWPRMAIMREDRRVNKHGPW